MRYRASWLIGVVPLCLLAVTSCGTSVLCSDARPVPVIASLMPSKVSFSQVQQTFVLTVNGSSFVSSSVILVNGVALKTTVVSSTSLKGTVSDTEIATAGAANVAVHTPSNLSGDVGCNSGGNSAALTLTVTN